MPLDQWEESCTFNYEVIAKFAPLCHPRLRGDDKCWILQLALIKENFRTYARNRAT